MQTAAMAVERQGTYEKRGKGKGLVRVSLLYLLVSVRRGDGWESLVVDARLTAQSGSPVRFCAATRPAEAAAMKKADFILTTGILIFLERDAGGTAGDQVILGIRMTGRNNLLLQRWMS